MSTKGDRQVKVDGEQLESLKHVREVVERWSWFSDAPHRWPIGALPLGYSMACVEVVCKESGEARNVYRRIIEAWGDPGVKAAYDEMSAMMSEADRDRIKDAFVYPEKELVPDANKPFRELEELFRSLEDDEDLLGSREAKELSEEETEDARKLSELKLLILEFIIVGFNRESDISKGRYRVLPWAKCPWLIIGVMIGSSLESHNITLERLRYVYKMRRYKGKTIDFHKVLTEEPMSRWHRRVVASGKAAKLKLKNDRIFVEAARHWYGCRVRFTSINKYCDAPGNYHLDPKNIDRQIRPCDDAVGYMRRLPKKKTMKS